MTATGGRFLSKKLGLWHFWTMFVGFNLTFFPMHILGLKGMPRRIASYPADKGWGTLNGIATLGSFLIAISILLFFINVLVSLRKPRTAPADPWRGDTLEWATTSPPPPHNFDNVPEVRSAAPMADVRAADADGEAVRA